MFNGLNLHLGSLSLLSNAQSRSLSAENFTGAKGAAKLDDRLIVVGGAAHSDLWMQIISDVTGYTARSDRAIRFKDVELAE